MIKTTKIILLLFSVLLPVSQTRAMSIKAFNQSLKVENKAMYILGGYAATNIVGGLALRSSASGSTRYFHEFNAIWNSVNLAIAGFGAWQLSGIDSSQMNAKDRAHHVELINRILMLNIGLDVAYMTAGYFMMKSFRNDRNEKTLGYGKGLILQGAFLFLFDILFYYAHTKISESDFQLKAGPTSVHFSYRF